jgi:NADH dehydrogenase
MGGASDRPRIVILGGGFAGATCARELERRLGRTVDVCLLDRRNYFVFTPLLIEAGTGQLEPRHAVVSLRAFLSRTRFLMGEVTGLLHEGGTVLVKAAGRAEETRIPFDHCIVALGGVTRLPPVPGLREYGFEMKDLADAVSLRDRAIRLLEMADASSDEEEKRRMLRMVVVGGNYTGVEVAGELHVFLRKACRLYENLRPDFCQVTLVELGERILPALDADLSRYARNVMERRGMRVVLGASATEVALDHVVLSTGEKIPAATTIWCAGIAPSPVVATLGLPLDAKGYIQCERDLRVKGMPNVWAIGDAAVNPDADGHPYPATAQHAVRQGKHLALNLGRVLAGKETLPCDIVSQGALAALGCRTGVARVFGINLSGWPAWFLWRTVYLMKIPGWGRRLRVAIDWTLDLVFGRDPVQLGIHDRHPVFPPRDPVV